MVKITVKIVLAIRKNGCVCKCEFGCVVLRVESFVLANWKRCSLTRTPKHTPKPIFICVPNPQSGAKKIRGHIGEAKFRIGKIYLWLITKHQFQPAISQF